MCRPVCLAALFLLITACGTGPERDHNPSIHHCYSVEADHGSGGTLIRVHLLGQLVNGRFSGLPLNNSTASGSFTGDIEDSVITALATFPTDSGQTRYELIFRMEKDGLRLGRGDRVYGDGIWLMRDKGQVSYGGLMPLTDCP